MAFIGVCSPCLGFNLSRPFQLFLLARTEPSDRLDNHMFLSLMIRCLWRP